MSTGPGGEGAASLESPESPTVELTIHHLRMPVSEYLPAEVALSGIDDPRRPTLLLTVEAAEAEALLDALRNGPRAVQKSSWVDRCMQVLTRAAALHGRRLLLRLVPDAGGSPIMLLEAMDGLSRLETPIPVAQGLMSTIRLGIPLLADVGLLHSTPINIEGSIECANPVEAEPRDVEERPSMRRTRTRDPGTRGFGRRRVPYRGVVAV